MSYYFEKKVDGDFEQVVERVRDSLADKGFGVLTEINVQETLKKKLDVDFYKYLILGACNPPFAYRALQQEDKIGVMLPCNVIVQQREAGAKVEVSAVDPIASMQSINNPELGGIAQEVRALLKGVVDSL
jgi:uncharacterized protein (DUF302 family)